ncbi:MAG TPA: hypothetical protein VK524_07395 [Polyangiaceae bacterium]|nr:hypothetical protein [Polyangiaceae bacterium]
MPSLGRLAYKGCQIAAGTALCALLFASEEARANGRFPASNQLLVAPNDSNRLWLRATQGLLTSTDRGCTWQWICERPLGIEGEEDPPLAITDTGAVVAAVFKGLYVSEDLGCSWRHDFPELNRFAVDVTVEKQNLSRALLLISAGQGGAATGNLNQVWRSADSGKSWAKIGNDLDPNLRLDTIDPAPSDPTKIYMTAQYQSESGQDDVGMFLYSENGGETWVTRPIPGTNNSYVAFLSAVHPTDPKKLYVRVRGPVVGRYVENFLLYSANAGETWQEILRGPADMLGFALSPDGSKVLVGMGDSRALGGTRPVDRAALGIYSASTADHEFTRGVEGHVGCLTWTADGIYVCTSEFYQGFELGLSLDEGQTVTAVMHLAGIKEPLQCPAGTDVANLCDERAWNTVCAATNRCEENTFEPLPVMLPEQCHAPRPKDESDDSGCGCRIFNGNSASSGILLGLFGLGWFAAHRRRRARSATPL